MKKSAFTLIELLVVIAIIAVLAGIALPVFSSAQEKSKVIKDGNNLHQIGIALVAYTNDNGDSLFLTGTSWSKAMNPKYIQDWKAFQSPFDKRTSDQTGISSPLSYDFNKNLLDKSMSDVAAPSLCIVIAPYITNQPVSNANAFSLTASSATASLDANSNGSGSSGGTHNNGKRINALFADAHVADMVMIDFHSQPPLANPDTTSSVRDLRWNK